MLVSRSCIVSFRGVETARCVVGVNTAVHRPLTERTSPTRTTYNRTSTEGATEIAGQENAALENDGQKLQGWKMTDTLLKAS